VAYKVTVVAAADVPRQSFKDIDVVYFVNGDTHGDPEAFVRDLESEERVLFLGAQNIIAAELVPDGA